MWAQCYWRRRWHLHPDQLVVVKALMHLCPGQLVQQPSGHQRLESRRRSPRQHLQWPGALAAAAALVCPAGSGSLPTPWLVWAVPRLVSQPAGLELHLVLRCPGLSSERRCWAAAQWQCCLEASWLGMV